MEFEIVPENTAISLMLLQGFIISNVIFAWQAIFSTLYIGKSSSLLLINQ